MLDLTRPCDACGNMIVVSDFLTSNVHFGLDKKGKRDACKRV